LAWIYIFEKNGEGVVIPKNVNIFRKNNILLSIFFKKNKLNEETHFDYKYAARLQLLNKSSSSACTVVKSFIFH